MSATTTAIADENYLTTGFSLRSWLTSTDHKRIAILYVIAITLFFFIGGAAATLIRMELVTPAGDLVAAETYNKLFTMHGVIMVWFFLIPSIPATLGNFLLPLMIGARDLAFPRINLASWYLYILGGLLFDPHRPELHSDDPCPTGPWNDVVSVALIRLGHLCDQPDLGSRHPGAGDDAGVDRDRASSQSRYLRPSTWRR